MDCTHGQPLCTITCMDANKRATRIGKIKPLFTRRLALVSPRTSSPQPPLHTHDGGAREATSPARLPRTEFCAGVSHHSRERPVPLHTAHILLDKHCLVALNCLYSRCNSRSREVRGGIRYQ